MRRLLTTILLLAFAFTPFPLAAAGATSPSVKADVPNFATRTDPLDSTLPHPNAPSSTDYYVNAATGSDTLNDGSITAPWKTITHALSQMFGAGLVLHVAAGTYNQALGETFPITMKSGISLSGAGPSVTVLSGTGSTAVVRFVGATAYASTTVLSGFKIEGGSEGVLIEGFGGSGTAPTIRDNRIEGNTLGLRNNAQYGQKIYAHIKNNLITNNSSHGVYNYAMRGIAESSPTLEENVITANGGSGLYCYATGTGHMYNNDYGVCSPTLIRNRIANNSGDGFTCHTAYTGGCSPMLDGNTILKNTGWGVGRMHDVTYLAPSAPEFYNNIIAGNAGGGARFSNGVSTDGDKDAPMFVNNTIAFNGSYGIIDGYPTIVNNIVWGHQLSDLNAPTSSVSYSDISQGTYPGTNNNVSLDPLFINRFNDDYHLTLLSPVIDIGNCSYVITTDVDGDSRSVGACTDMGADEVSHWQSSQQAANPTAAQPGQSIAYTLTVTNTSDLGRTGVVVSDTLDSHVFFVSASDGGVFSSGAAVWNGLTVPAHSAATVSLVVSVSSPLPDATDVVNRVQIRDSVPAVFNIPAAHTPIYNPAQAAFDAIPTVGLAPLPVVFENQSLHATSALWSYGDGSSSTQSISHSHTYNSAGSYTVTLQVTNPASSDTLTRTHYITAYNAVQANFVGTPTVGPSPLSVSFTNNSLYGDQFLWDYGDGTTSTTTANTHVHIYPAQGTYTVSLRASSIYSSNILTRTNYITVAPPDVFLPSLWR